MKIMALTIALAATPAWADSHPPKEAIPETCYQSAFADYKPFKDETLYDWSQVNDEMGRLRGHMGHLETGQAAGQPTHEHGKPAERTPQASGDKP